MATEAKEMIKRYLEDAIAAEKNFQSQLLAFSVEGDVEDVKQLFAQHAEETRSQHERLTRRLEQMGGSPSAVKSFLAHMFALAPTTGQLGQDGAERVTQNLLIAYAVEHTEIAMYERLATVAKAAGDKVTEKLAREIQREEKRTAGLVWDEIARNARSSFNAVTGRRTMTP